MEDNKKLADNELVEISGGAIRGRGADLANPDVINTWCVQADNPNNYYFIDEIIGDSYRAIPHSIYGDEVKTYRYIPINIIHYEIMKRYKRITNKNDLPLALQTLYPEAKF